MENNATQAKTAPAEPVFQDPEALLKRLWRWAQMPTTSIGDWAEGLNAGKEIVLEIMEEHTPGSTSI